MKVASMVMVMMLALAACSQETNRRATFCADVIRQLEQDRRFIDRSVGVPGREVLVGLGLPITYASWRVVEHCGGESLPDSDFDTMSVTAQDLRQRWFGKDKRLSHEDIKAINVHYDRFIGRLRRLSPPMPD